MTERYAAGEYERWAQGRNPEPCPICATSAARIEALEAALRETSEMLGNCTFNTMRIRGQYVERLEVVERARALLARMGYAADQVWRKGPQMNETEIMKLEEIANMMRGMTMDPRIPSDARQILKDMACEIDEITEAALAQDFTAQGETR